MDAATADVFAKDWIAAWKRRDVEALVAHYAPNIEFRSPVAARLLGEPSGMVRGKENLRAYFTRALAAFPGELDIELRGVYQGVNSLVVLFEARGRKGAEVMEFDSDTLVYRAMAHSHAA